jgi:hypothetical protein
LQSDRIADKWTPFSGNGGENQACTMWEATGESRMASGVETGAFSLAPQNHSATKECAFTYGERGCFRSSEGLSQVIPHGENFPA